MGQRGVMGWYFGGIIVFPSNFHRTCAFCVMCTFPNARV